ncbi:WD repeat-containing protein, partial [Trifolium pratense]
EMVKDKLKEPVLTAFTPTGDYVAILSSNATVKVSIAYDDQTVEIC